MSDENRRAEKIKIKEKEEMSIRIKKEGHLKKMKVEDMTKS